MSFEDLKHWIQDRVGGKPAPAVAVLRLEGVIGGRGVRGLTLQRMAQTIERAFKLRNLKAVALAVNSPDTCNVSCNITQVTGTDGATAADSQITGALTANLRADRTGKDKNGRVYTLQLTCSDAASNSATKTVAVTVPHDQGK